MASEDFVSKYVAQAATAADVTGRPYSADELGLNANPAASISNVPSFLASTIADVGTSLWNSVISIPKLWGGNTDGYRADTYDLLKSVNEDWANFYSGHQEAVQTASFVGGVLVPAGAAMKGMKLLQAGKVGFYPATLSDAAQATRMSELQGMLELGGKATTEYRNLRWSLLAANAGQETLMAVGTEIAVIGAMSQHPMMEDYMKDPVKNFFIWAAVGGVVGTAMGQIATRKLLADTIGAVETEALDPVLRKLIAVPKGIAIGDSIQRFGANVEQMEGIIADKGVKAITRQWAESFADQFRGIIGKLETEGGYFAAELKTAAPEVRQGAREVGMSDAAFGANQVNILTYDTKEFLGRKQGHDFLTVDMATLDAISTKYDGLWKAGYRVRSALIASNAIKEFSPDWARLMNEEFHVGYSPFHKAWIPQSELPFYTRAVDTGQRTYSKVPVFKIDTDASLQFGTREIPSATVDKQWIDALGTVANAQLERSVHVASGDIAVQNALLSRLLALEAEGKPLPKVFITPDAAGNATQSTLKAQGKEVTLSGLEDNLAREKERQIKSLLKAGASLQEIGIKTNMGTDAVEHFLQTRQPLNAFNERAGEAANTNWRLYTNAGAIDTEYLGQTSRMLQFATNGYRKASLAHRNADMSANLDSKAISQANRGYMENTIAGGQSSVLKEWFQVLASDNRDWDILAAEVSNIVNSKMGSSFLTSADFAARRMGGVGGIATRKGQEAFGFNNRISQEWLTPVATQMRAFTTSQVGLNEFNRVVNLVNGTSGYVGLDAKTGQLFRRTENEPGVFFQSPLKDNNGGVVSLSPGLSTLLQEIHKVTREQYEMKNVLNRIQGFKDMNDRGLYLPTFNPVNKFISYVIDKEAAEGASKVRILMAKSPDELASLERDWTSKHGATKSSTGGTKYDLVTKSKQEDYNFWKMREDPLEMDHTDISKFHSGASASAADVFDDVYASTLVENLHNRFIHYGRKMQEMYLHDTMSTLDMMSNANKQFFAAQPTAARSVGVAQREDAAMFIKNTILGNPQLNQFTTWQSFNNSVSSVVEYAGRKVTDTWRNAAYRDKEQRVLKEGEYVRIAQELGDHGAVNPFKSYDEYVSTRQALQREQKYSVVAATTPEEVQAATRSNTPAEGQVFSLNFEGKNIGYIDTSFNEATKTINVNYLKRFNGEAKITPSEWKSIGVQLKQEFPDATSLTKSERISGVRKKAAFDKINDPSLSAEERSAELAGFNYPLVDIPVPQYTAGQVGKRVSANEMEVLRVQEIARKHAVPYARAEQIVAANNGILATVALRVLETGQAAVTAMSWPIMMLPEFYRAFPKTYLGNAIGEGVSVAFPARAIYDGIRFRHSDMAAPLIKQWIDQGFGKSIVSEASSINTMLSMGEIGMMGKIQKALESPMMKKISFASDFMEGETRLWVLSTGYMAAKRIYPGISVHDADAFAKEFLMKSIGNYYSAQRPAMFQGTFGVAIGLFQTYMLSWGQSMYRSIEEGAGKAIAAQMLSQAGLFGMSSLPLYDQFSKIIGSNFSDKHYDLQTGTYRAMPDGLAEFVTYGLPASLGVGLYTRGDMQPRVPFTQTNGLDTFAAINVARQLYGATGHTISKVLEANGMSDKVRGLLEGLSMQSLSRPLARIVETIPLPDGQGGVRAVGSISRDGNTISTSEDIWSGPGLASRLLASRSTEEAVKREVDYLNTFYGALDHQNRKHATETLKSSIRSGTLDDETLSKTAATYLRTGTAVGWKAALNEALATTEGGIDYKLGKTLRSDSPLNKMIEQYK